MNLYGTDPIDPDTDGDGVEDGCEVECGTDPPPRVEAAREGVVPRELAPVLKCQLVISSTVTPPKRTSA